MAVDPMLIQLAATDRNPAQNTQYQQLLQQAGIPFTNQGGKTVVEGFGAGGNGTGDQAQAFFGQGGQLDTNNAAINAMKQAQAFQVQQNQPAIATLQGQQQSLPDQYTALLNEIKGSGTAATNYGIQGAGENLAARGITPDSALYNTTVSQAIAPIGLQYGGLEANLGQGSIDTMTALAGSIAALQAGNVPNALNFGANIAGLQNALQVANIQANQPRTLNPGQAVVDPVTGKTISYNGPAVTTTPTSTTPPSTGGASPSTPITFTTPSSPTRTTTPSVSMTPTTNTANSPFNQNGINPLLLNNLTLSSLNNVSGLPTSMNGTSSVFGGLSFK